MLQPHPNQTLPHLSYINKIKNNNNNILPINFKPKHQNPRNSTAEFQRNPLETEIEETQVSTNNKRSELKKKKK